MQLSPLIISSSNDFKMLFHSEISLSLVNSDFAVDLSWYLPHDSDYQATSDLSLNMHMAFPLQWIFAACAFIVKGTKICAIRRNSPCANARQLFVSRREETLSTNSKCCYLVPFGCLRADGGRETWQNSGFKESEELGTGEKVWSRKYVSTSKCQWRENVHGRVDVSPHHWKLRNLNSARSGQYVCLFLHFQSSPIQFKLGGHTNTDMHTRCER